jgi:hypothetical protein
VNRHLLLLVLRQGLFLTNNVVVFIAINGLVGLELAPSGWLATLPVTGYVVGGALSSALVGQNASGVGPQALVPDGPGGVGAVGQAVRLCRSSSPGTWSSVSAC